MNRSQFLSSCIITVFLAGTALSTPAVLRAETTAAPEATPLPTATVTQSETIEPASETSDPATIDVANRIRNNLLTDQPTLRLISTGTAIKPVYFA